MSPKLKLNEETRTCLPAAQLARPGDSCCHSCSSSPERLTGQQSNHLMPTTTHKKLKTILLDNYRAGWAISASWITLPKDCTKWELWEASDRASL